MLSGLPLHLFLLKGVLPLALLQLVLVPAYLLWFRRLRRRVPRREALFHAPLSAPIAFTVFFIWYEILGRGPVPGAAAMLSSLFILTWLPGLAAGATALLWINRRRSPPKQDGPAAARRPQAPNPAARPGE